jgi:hypothetical protein
VVSGQLKMNAMARNVEKASHEFPRILLRATDLRRSNTDYSFYVFAFIFFGFYPWFVSGHLFRRAAIGHQRRRLQPLRVCEGGPNDHDIKIKTKIKGLSALIRENPRPEVAFAFPVPLW